MWLSKVTLGKAVHGEGYPPSDIAKQVFQVHGTSNPAAQWTGAHKGHAFFAYVTNYLIDTDHGVILDVEATRAIRQADVGAARIMIDRTEQRFGLKPGWL